MSDYLMSQANDDEERDDIQFERLVQKRKLAFKSLLNNKDQARVETREIPLQLLALEWFNKIDASIETRAYLVENFLPILVLGCEKVLKDAQKRHLVDENKKDVDFNPINLLGQFLMRNNPKYNNQNETSAYVRTMREVYHELREQMFSFQENKLAKVKADIRQRRNDRESVQKSRQTEINRRCEKLENVFAKWHISSNGRIEIAVIIDSLNMYNDHIGKMPVDTKRASEINLNALPSYCFTRDGYNLTKRILRNEFVQCMLAVTDNLSSEFFDLFTEFLCECTNYFVIRANRTRLNKILKRLFNLIDSTETGLLMRRRLMLLLDEFLKTRVSPEFKPCLRDPMQWPILDPYLKFENKIEIKSTKTNEESDEQTDYVEPSITSDPKPVEEPLVENSEGTEATLPEPVPENKPEEEEAVVNEESPAEPIDNAEEGEKAAEEAVVDKVEEVAVKSEVVDNVDAVADDAGEDEDEDMYVPVTTVLSKENELLFLNGGIMYYKPLEDSLHAFEEGLIKEQKNPRASARSKKAEDTPLAFDNEFLDAKQFLNIFSSFIQPQCLDSEKTINELLVFLKDNYAESQREKNNKLERQAFEKKLLMQRDRFGSCFEKLDAEGSRTLLVTFISEVLANFKDGMFKDQIEQATESMKKRIKFNGRDDEVIYKEEFIDYIMDLIKLADFPKFEDQIMSYLNGLVMPTNKAKDRSECRKFWLSQIERVGDLTYGSFEPLYKQLFVTLAKDTETHENNKVLSAYVGILESVGDNLIDLKFNASTPHDSNFILGKTLNKNTPNVTFSAIDENKCLHIESVKSNPNVHYFNPENNRDGSLLVYPLKYSRNKIYGTIGFDTIQETNANNQLFKENEVSFYQGVANTFASAYANIVFKNRMAKTIQSSIEWLNARHQSIEECNVYIVQMVGNDMKLVPSEKDSASSVNSSETQVPPVCKVNLKPVMRYQFSRQGLVDKCADAEEEAEKRIGPSLYECAMTSESTTDLFNSKLTNCFPIRNEKNKTIFVIELISDEAAKANAADLELLETVIYVLDLCQKELLAECFMGHTFNKYKFETEFEHEKFAILFEKKYLKVITDRLGNLADGHKLIELLPDGSESPETSKTKNLFKLVADLVSCPEFGNNDTKTGELVEKLKNYDVTSEGFKFKHSQNLFDLSTDNVLKQLHSFNVELGSVNSSIKQLVDWVCLQSEMRRKAENAKALNQRN